MTNMADIETALRLEVTHWFPRQCRDSSAEFHLYYLPTTAEHDGGLLIAHEKPANDEYQVAGRLNAGLTIDQNMNALRAICRTLPILTT